MGEPAHRADSENATSAVTRVGRYELVHRIASGGMASVHLARATAMAGFERLVAVKCCHPHLLEDEQFAEMFLLEARLAARIHHPNVVPVLDVGRDGALYLVMEYVDGDRLAELIRAATTEPGGALTVPIALRIVLDMLAGLHAAHETVDPNGRKLHIVHRDVSPQNVLVGIDGITRLTDFGIAKAADSAVTTDTGEVRGKMGYLAPEQLSGGLITRQIDVFSAGVVAWETLTGRRLFGAHNRQRSNEDVIAPPSSVRAGIAASLDRVVLSALAREPSMRFQTAQEFADAIEATNVPVARARDVAATVERLLGTALQRRRTSIQELTATRDVVGPRNDTPTLQTTPEPVANTETPPVATAESAPGASAELGTASAAVGTVSRPDTRHAPRRQLAWSLAVAMFVAAIVGGVFLVERWLRPSERNDSAREARATGPTQSTAVDRTTPMTTPTTAPSDPPPVAPPLAQQVSQQVVAPQPIAPTSVSPQPARPPVRHHRRTTPAGPPRVVIPRGI